MELQHHRQRIIRMLSVIKLSRTSASRWMDDGENKVACLVCAAVTLEWREKGEAKLTSVAAALRDGLRR